MQATLFILATLFVMGTAAHDNAEKYIREAAPANGVPVELALRVSKVESGTRCGVHNKKSSASGPLQILKGTAQDLGYPQIRKQPCKIQVLAGIKYLAICIRLTNSWYDAARCYYGGPGVIKNSKQRYFNASHRYAEKVMGYAKDTRKVKKSTSSKRHAKKRSLRRRH